MSAHTPGPWKIIGGNPNWLIAENNPNLGNGVICELKREKQLENARLIAAAPEMFELLKKCLDTWQKGIFDLTIPERTKELIKKIEGEL